MLSNYILKVERWLGRKISLDEQVIVENKYLLGWHPAGQAAWDRRLAEGQVSLPPAQRRLLRRNKMGNHPHVGDDGYRRGHRSPVAAMTDPIPALLWQTDIDVLVAHIESDHAKWAANFNQYVVSEAMMELCARIQRNVSACYVRNGDGLLQFTPEMLAYFSQPVLAASRRNHRER